jgi:DNA repair ATPase RecN
MLNNPFSSRDKRNFLLEINSSIQARREFDQQLEQEKKSLQAAGTELERIRTELKALSESTIEEQHLENLLDKHETYSALERDCVVLLETRQRNSGDSNRGKATKSMSHELNEYLYNDLETQYPILATGIRAISRIREERKIENNTAISRMSFGG